VESKLLRQKSASLDSWMDQAPRQRLPPALGSGIPLAPTLGEGLAGWSGRGQGWGLGGSRGRAQGLVLSRLERQSSGLGSGRLERQGSGLVSGRLERQGTGLGPSRLERQGSGLGNARIRRGLQEQGVGAQAGQGAGPGAGVGPGAGTGPGTGAGRKREKLAHQKSVSFDLTLLEQSRQEPPQEPLRVPAPDPGSHWRGVAEAGLLRQQSASLVFGGGRWSTIPTTAPTSRGPLLALGGLRGRTPWVYPRTGGEWQRSMDPCREGRTQNRQGSPSSRSPHRHPHPHPQSHMPSGADDAGPVPERALARGRASRTATAAAASMGLAPCRERGRGGPCKGRAPAQPPGPQQGCAGLRCRKPRGQ